MISRRQSKAAAKPFRPTVDAGMNVMDVIALHGKAGDILGAYGLHCFNCAFNTMDSIESGAKSHGLTDTDIENLVTDLQELIDSAPAKPSLLTLTEAAAKQLKAIGKQEKKKTVCLRVTTDAQSGFCMEFTTKPFSTDSIFVCDKVKNVSLVASPETLWKIGGSTVDFRDGRFKLDLIDACECAGKGCTCEKS